MKEYWFESQDGQMLIASLPQAFLGYRISLLSFLGLSSFICYDDRGEVVMAVMFYIFPVDTLVKLTLGFGDVCCKLLPGFTKADASTATAVA